MESEISKMIFSSLKNGKNNMTNLNSTVLLTKLLQSSGVPYSTTTSSIFETLFTFFPWLFNPFFLLIFGSIFGFIFKFYEDIKDYLFRKFFLILDISDRDEVYQYVLQFLSSSEYCKNSSHLKFVPKSRKYNKYSGYNKPEDALECQDKVDLKLLPAPGQHFFTYKNKWLWLDYRSEGKNVYNQNTGSYVHDSISISIFGHNKKILFDFLQESYEIFLEKQKQKTLIYVPDSYAEAWQLVSLKSKRKPHTVVLKDGLMEDLYKDFKEFMNSYQWYVDRGIPHRRGYLLWGPPGTGKSSTVAALVGSLNLNICQINLSSKNLDDDKLNILMSDMPKNCVLLIEDIDSNFSKKKKKGDDDDKDNDKDKKNEKEKNEQEKNNNQSMKNAISNETENKLTFSGLLNCLDGVATKDGRILIMTTNHREQLNEALARPGRIDKEIFVGYASKCQMRRLIKNFYPIEVLKKDYYQKNKNKEKMKELKKLLTQKMEPLSPGTPGKVSLSKIFDEFDNNSEDEDNNDNNNNNNEKSIENENKKKKDKEIDFEKQREDLIDQFIGKMEKYNEKITCAEIQGHLLNYKTSLKGALENIQSFIDNIEKRIQRYGITKSDEYLLKNKK